MTDKSNAYAWIWDNPNERWVKVLGASSGIVISCRCANTITDKRMTLPGLVVSGGVYLFWLTFNPAGGGAKIELTDAVEAGAAIKWDFLGEKTGGNHLSFDPPLHFVNGIYLETAAELLSAIFGYDI